MLQNDTFCIFFSQFSFNIVFLFFLNIRCREKEALRKRRVRQQFRGRWKRRKLKKWDRLYSGVSFFNCCVHPWIPPAECYCDLVSCSEKSMTGERSPLSGSPLILCISSSFPFCLHRFFGGGAVRGGVTGRGAIPPYWYFAFFSEGFRIYNTQTSK